MRTLTILLIFLNTVLGNRVLCPRNYWIPWRILFYIHSVTIMGFLLVVVCYVPFCLVVGWHIITGRYELVER
jgi:hypothetical protein